MEDEDPSTQRSLLQSDSSSLLFARFAAGESSSGTFQDEPALQLDDHNTDWGTSRPVLVLDLIWNLAFVIVSSVVLVMTTRERPSTPLRAWIVGYAAQCLLHVSFVLSEHRRRVLSSNEQDVQIPEDRSSFAKTLESGNTILSFFWWLVGFYWIVVGGQPLLQDAPRLYWLTVVFLAFDVFFAIFCILLAFFIGMALCCCLPCIVAFLYAAGERDAVPEAEIGVLPRFRYHRLEGSNSANRQSVTVPTAHTTVTPSGEIIFAPDDSDCCICLSRYEEGAELRCLPCNHHFHSDCIIRWLHINTTCPLCKYNIIRADDRV